MTTVSIPNTASPTTNIVLRDTLRLIAGMLLITAVAAAITTQLQLPLMAGKIATGCGFALLFFIRFCRQLISPLATLGCILAFSLLEGIGMGPILHHILNIENGSALIGTAALLTSLTTASCSYVAHTSKQDFSKYTTFLVIAAVLVFLVGIISHFYPSYTMLMTFASGAAVVFTGFLLTNLQDVMKGKQKNYMLAAIDIYVSLSALFNIFLILAGTKRPIGK